MPYTAIMLHQLTGAKVTVIDNNKHCVKQSAELVKRLNLENSIRIICGEGETIDYDGFTVIHLALQITPKDKVLKRVLERAEEGVKSLCVCPGNVATECIARWNHGLHPATLMLSMTFQQCEKYCLI